MLSGVVRSIPAPSISTMEYRGRRVINDEMPKTVCQQHAHRPSVHPPFKSGVQILHDRELERVSLDVALPAKFLVGTIEPPFEFRFVFLGGFVGGSVVRVVGVFELPSTFVRYPAHWEEDVGDMFLFGVGSAPWVVGKQSDNMRETIAYSECSEPWTVGWVVDASSSWCKPQ